MKQAQKMQKDMLDTQNKINEMEFIGESSLVTVKVDGSKKVLEVKIKTDELEKDDIEILEDMITVATNDALSKVDEVTQEKMGKYTQGMPGLF